jgi:hypothetical protein
LTNNQSHPMESVVVTPNVTASVVANSSAASSSLIEQILPKKGSAEEEHSFSMAIFFVLAVIGRSSFLFPLKLLLLMSAFHSLPFSVLHHCDSLHFAAQD